MIVLILGYMIMFIFLYFIIFYCFCVKNLEKWLCDYCVIFFLVRLIEVKDNLMKKK